MSCNVFFEIVSKDSDKNAIKREQREKLFLLFAEREHFSIINL